MEQILPGQFFREIDDTGEITAGWTVIHTESVSRPRQPSSSARVVVIRNDVRTATPTWGLLSDIISKVREGDWISMPAPQKPAVVITALEPSYRARALEERDRKLNLIQPLIDLGAELYHTHPRRQLIKKIATEIGLTTGCLWEYLCLYWQFGNNPDGLLPRHSLSGQRSLQERFQSHAEDPSGFREYKTGVKPRPEAQAGIPIRFRDIKLCRKGADKYLFIPSADHSLVLKWQNAYDATLVNLYGHDQDNTLPAPSIDQFKTIVRGDPDFEVKKIKIIGENTYKRNFRQLTGSSRSKLLGPGQQGQLDDCTSKVILLDEITRLPLGTGRFFCLIDSWSKLIAGLHDTLEGSTFSEAMECLYVSYTDKKEYFADQGITANPDMFPAKGVFKSIVADNGPLRGYVADKLPKSIGYVTNTRAYRPDDKSDIESSFNAYLKQCAARIPGYNRVERCRGDSDPEIIAYLTTSEYRGLLWLWAEGYQQRRLAGWWPQAVLESPEKPKAHSPIEIWNWGAKHVGGALTYRPTDELRRSLLASSEATLTARRGLKLNGLIYILNKDEVPSSIYYRFSRSTKVTVFYSTKYTPRVFISIEGQFYLGYLRSDLMEPFGKMTFAEVENNYEQLLATTRTTKANSDKVRRTQLVKAQGIISAAKDANLARFGSQDMHQAVADASSMKQTRAGALRNERRKRFTEHADIFKSPSERRAMPDESAAPDSKPSNVRKLSIDEMLDE